MGFLTLDKKLAEDIEFASQLSTIPDFKEFDQMSKDYRTARDVITKMKKYFEINGTLNFSRLVKENYVKIERHHAT